MVSQLKWYGVDIKQISGLAPPVQESFSPLARYLNLGLEYFHIVSPPLKGDGSDSGSVATLLPGYFSAPRRLLFYRISISVEDRKIENQVRYD